MHCFPLCWLWDFIPCLLLCRMGMITLSPISQAIERLWKVGKWSQKICPTPNPTTSQCDMWPYLKIMISQIQLRISRWENLRFRVGPKSNDNYSYKRQKGRRHRDTQGKTMWKPRQRMESHSYQPRGMKNCQQSPQATEDHGTYSPWLFRRNQSCQHLGFRILVSRIVRE